MIVFRAIQGVFREKIFLALFVAIVLLMFFLFTLIPALTVPGNSLRYQLSILSIQDHLLLAFLSALSALYITMQIFAMKVTKRRAQGIGGSAVGGAGALFAGVAGSAFCAACLAPLFAVFGIGLGGVIFVLDYRYHIVAAAALLIGVAIYFLSRKIVKACDC